MATTTTKTRPATEPGPVTAEAQAALAVEPAETLVQHFAAMTHALHDASHPGMSDLRAKRDLVKAEILRRMRAL